MLSRLGSMGTSAANAALYEQFDTNGISNEELDHWSELAPEGQKLTDVLSPARKGKERTRKRKREEKGTEPSASKKEPKNPSSPESQAPEKDVLEPKTQEEAHINYLKSNERDPNEHGTSIEKTPQENREILERENDFAKKISNIIHYSNDKQLEQYEHGGMKGASKQVKEDLKEMNEERKMEEAQYKKLKDKPKRKTSPAQMRKRNGENAEPPDEPSKRRKSERVSRASTQPATNSSGKSGL